MKALSDLLADAVADGLQHLNITRLHRGQHWQAAARFENLGGYRVGIEETPEQAVRKALTAPTAAPVPPYPPETQMPTYTPKVISAGSSVFD